MPDLINILSDRFRSALTAAYGDEHADTDPLLAAAKNPKFGDYQANLAMGLAKKLGQKPRDVAAALIEKLDLTGVCAGEPEIAGPGFINLRLDDAFVEGQLGELAADDRLGVPAATSPQKVVVDYSSPNVAKEMHVGHLRSTIIGDCLARVLAFQGHTVVRQNHLGDWGTQFGMLIEHLIDQGWETGGDHSVSDLDELYREAKQRDDGDADFAERARRRVTLLQGGDETSLKLWHELIDESKRHFNYVYGRLGVQLTDDDIRSESSYNDMLPDVVADLDKLGLLVESDGAAVVFPEGFVNKDGEPQGMIVRKTDGSYLYSTTDLAGGRHRVDYLHADRVVYVTDARQAQHFAMVFWTLRKTGWGPKTVRFEYVPFGMVLGGDRKPYKTREGGTVKLAGLIDEAVSRARAVIHEKNPDLGDECETATAEAIGIGAVKYCDLSSDRIKDYVFDWDRMLSFDGNTAPYLLYSYVRIRSILRKGEIDPDGHDTAAIQPQEPAERALGLMLFQFADVVTAVADSLEPHRMCNYLYELATLFHRFFEQCPVLKAPSDEIRASRLSLCILTSRVLKTGLNLLGIQTVERM